MVASADTPGDETRDLEADRQRREQQLQAVRERYERLLDERARLRRGTGSDEQFVWTRPDDGPGAGSDTGRRAQTDGGRPARASASTSLLRRIAELFR